jgi:hypothetical protein
VQQGKGCKISPNYAPDQARIDSIKVEKTKGKYKKKQ